MLTWDLARLIDWLEEDRRFNTDRLGAVGFSGGGMQTLWLTALDDRVKFAAISGYMYGYRDALLDLNNKLFLQLCAPPVGASGHGRYCQPHCTPPVVGAVLPGGPAQRSPGRGKRSGAGEIAAEAYRLLGVPENLRHQICPGTHQWHEEDLAEYLTFLLEHSINSKE